MLAASPLLLAAFAAFPFPLVLLLMLLFVLLLLVLLAAAARLAPKGLQCLQDLLLLTGWLLLLLLTLSLPLRVGAWCRSLPLSTSHEGFSQSCSMHTATHITISMK